MKIVVEGCAHGDLDRIYSVIQSIEQKQKKQVDLLICCGDFQSTRNLADLQCMAVPAKYLDMCSFYKYYSGEKVAPILTIFIGGNHEASNYLQELSYGGWVAPNIYYLGYAGVINVNGVRIGGISGIFRDYNFEKGHFEFPPYDQSSIRSVYDIRSLEVFRLSQLTTPINIMLSHDWPDQIWEYGNKEQLLRFKPYFRNDMENGRMGSGPCWDLLTTLRPRYWYAAHMHCRFDASVPHDNNECTKFVALDKCMPNRKFLDFLTIGDDDESAVERAMPEIKYDLEWLTVLYLTNNLLNVSKDYTKLPLQPGPDDIDNVQRFEFTPSEHEKEIVLKKFDGNLKIPKNFTQTVPAYEPLKNANFRNLNETIRMELNPQTTEFCAKLGIDDPLFLAAKFAKVNLLTSTVDLAKNKQNQELPPESLRAPLASFLPKPKFSNADEINLDELEEEFTVNTSSDALEVAEEVKHESEATDKNAIPESVSEVVPSKKLKRRNIEIYAGEENN